ncbi:hypothetical protein LGM48_00685 [Burkholderia multivorans]|uniref:T6SS effector BTH_I2691 family protein n=1 Tax=Burkholderia multivorans TaxID=87883 RepID=UPI001C28116C|nr:T6SS effector BTH_I2691 family protein [Burkholderia multivorans]MBU9542109.1 hypothetical protein [Burkholderia multivorans]MCA8172816.1 hypothetical protein [Burkholderia multivorans]
MALDTNFASISQLTQSAMQTSSRAPNSCNMCKKKGLPILPVRYGVVANSKAHSAAGAMSLMGGKFGDGVVGVPLKRAKYTLRTLRYGYVYIFYPKTQRWQIYAVTAEGYLYDYPVGIKLDRSFEKPFSCHQPGHAQLAQCITIEDAEHAGTVYLAFSDELWTQKVRDMYAKNFMGCRDKRMQKFDATAWYNGNMNQLHADSVDHLEGLLSEYKGGRPDALVTGCFPYHDRAGQQPALKKAMDSVLPNKGLFFALWDPVGITQELNFEQRVAFGAALAPYEHGIWTASAIDALQKAVAVSAKEDVERAAGMLEANTYEGMSLGALFDGGKALEKQLKSIETKKTAELATAGPEAWKPYTTHYRQQAIVDFRKKMANAMKQEQTSTLVPLSQDHQAWLSSPALLNVFEFDYEPGSWRCGLNYTNTFTRCIEGSADRKETVDVLVKWAEGSVSDTRNPLLRAFVLNSPVLAEKVKEASSYPYAELREFVAKLIESYSKIEGVEETKEKGIKTAVAKALAWLLHETGGPVAEAISASVDAATAKVLYATLCMRTKQLFEFRAVYGSVNQWVNYIACQMQEMMSGRQKISVQNLKKQFQDKANAGGGAVPQVKVKQFVPVENPSKEAAMLASVKANAGFEKLASATLTPDVVETIYMPKFRLMTKGEPGFAGIGAIFSAVNLRFAREELSKANRFNQTEASIKFDNAVGGLVAGVAQYGSAAIDAFSKTGVRLGTGWLRLERFLNVAGKYGGATVGLVSAAIDAYHAVQDFKEGNLTMFVLDVASAAVGLVLAYSVVFLSASAAAVVTLPLLLIAAVIGILMNYFKGKEVDEWLERCFFGLKETKDRFQTLSEDQKAFAAVFS